MRHIPLVVVLLVLVVGTTASMQTARSELENVAAVARLYGVIRYFYPSDAAASLDWNRFAVHATKEARAARSTKDLEAVLKTLVAPLGPGIVIGARLPAPPPKGATDPTLVAWRYFGAAIGQPAAAQGPYKAKRTNRPLIVPSTLDGFAGQMQAVPALNLRGRAIRLRGMVRADARDMTGSAALWLRVDRGGNQPGFFDNMADRPVRDRNWREYSIVGDVADDATSIAFGTGALGAVVADFDAIALESRLPGGAWTPVAIQDPGFEGVWIGGWMSAGNSKRAVVTRPSDQAPEGKQFLRVAAPPELVSTTELYAEGAPIAGASIDIDLGTGLKARVPLALSDADASATAANPALRGLQSALAALPEAPPSTDLDTRLADTVVAWNVFRHFYPYWKEAGVDWNARLVPLLDDARKAATREQHRDALRRLVAEIGDGHGSVNDRRNTSPRTTVPIQLRVVEKRVVVTASAAPAEVPVGAVLTTIGRVPAEKRLDDLTQLASGTPQWRQTRALNEMIVCTQGSPVTLTVDAGAGPRSATLPCGGTQPTDEKRPDPVSELRPGIWYVDLTRARAQQLTAAIGTLSGGRGVVFDVRGYPTDAGAAILPHLIGAAEQDRWMHVGKLVGPNFDVAAWEDLGWNVQPASPRIGGRAVFLTDGRAISYAESVMGYVADRKLGTIIGAPTAGANGNVAVFPVPGGFTIAFTGMRVTRHDGSSPHHLVGIQPDIPLAPTIAAIRAGRDELIERAISVIEQK